MTTPHEVSLTLASTSTRLLNWDGYELALDMFQLGSPWTFKLWHSDATDASWARMSNEVRLGDQVTVAIDGAPQLTGRIERRNVVADRSGGAVLVINGRDLIGSAIDWDADPRVVLRGRALEDVLRELFALLGVRVVVGVHAAAAREVQSRARRGARGVASDRARRRHRVDLSRARPDETVLQVVDSILRKLGYMLWVAPTGDGQLGIVVDVPDYDQAPLYALERRFRDGVVTPESNILESDYQAQIRDIPTVVYAMGHAPRGDVQPSRHMTVAPNAGLFNLPADVLGNTLNLGYGAVPAPLNDAARATTTRLPYTNRDLARTPLVIDPLPPQPRFLHTRRALDPATGRREAERYMALAMRKFRTYACWVQGHGQYVGGQMRLYAVNTMARVFDPVSELDEAMFLQRVVFTGSRDPSEGQRTHLTLGARGAVVLTPEDSP